MSKPTTPVFESAFGPVDLHLFGEGNHERIYELLGAHPEQHAGVEGVRFAVWAPNATGVSVVGEFNSWDGRANPLRPVGSSGIWEGFVAGVGKGVAYKYHIASRLHGYRVDKSDPVAFCSEVPPKTASRVWDLEYTWGDQTWMKERH